MNTKRKRYDWTEPYGAYRRHLVFFDLAAMIPGDFRGVFREKEEEYRKIHEEERTNPRRCHKFTKYFAPLMQHFTYTYLENPLFVRFMSFLEICDFDDTEVCLINAPELSEQERALLFESLQEIEFYVNGCENSTRLPKKIIRIFSGSSREETVSQIREVLAEKNKVTQEVMARCKLNNLQCYYDPDKKPEYVIISKEDFSAEFENHSCVYSEEPVLVTDTYLHRAFYMLYRQSSLMGTAPERYGRHFTPFRDQKIIFLDVDGVLNRDGKDENGNYEHVNAGMVKELRYITEKTGAIIIMSSSWRRHIDSMVGGEKNTEECYDILTDYFLREKLVISGLTPYGGMQGGITRPLEILTWLAKYPDIDSFVILDDEVLWDWGFLKRNVVTTLTPLTAEESAEIEKREGYCLRETKSGLTRKLADRAVEILMRKAPDCIMRG